MDDISFQGYALAMGKLIGPKAISYISDNQICAYLSKKKKKEIVTHLINDFIKQSLSTTKTNVNSGSKDNNIQRLPGHTKLRTEFVNIFKRDNLKLCFKITTLKAGMTDYILLL